MNIIGISGKKQSGKDTLANFIKSYLYAKDHRETIFRQNEEGKISWEKNPNILDISTHKMDSINTSWNIARVYSFADTLKEFCINVLGLSKEQVYGTDKEKNTFTKYLWNNFPLSVRFRYRIKGLFTSFFRTGHMTARELMQVIGTDVGRRMFCESIWVDATISRIKKDKPKVALIRDVRFKSEIDAIIKNGGFIIRLERKISNDSHPSEIDLDHYDWNSLGSKCCLIHNEKCTLQEKNDMALNFIKTVTKD